MEAIKVKIDKFSKDLDKVPALQALEDKTKVPKVYVVGGVLAVAALCLLTGYGAFTVCQLTGFLYPAIESFRAIESTSKADDTQWLTYWLVFSALNIVETLLTFLIEFIPFYFVFKMALLLWLLWPTTRGAEVLYKHVLKDLMVKSESKVDSAMDKLKKVTSNESKTVT